MESFDKDSVKWFEDSIKWHREQIDWYLDTIGSSFERINSHRGQIKKLEQGLEEFKASKK